MESEEEGGEAERGEEEGVWKSDEGDAAIRGLLQHPNYIPY